MNRIKDVLKDKGISQTWLAEKMGKSYPSINEYARNKRQPSLEDLYKIAEILNVEVKELLIERTELNK
jgi:putative transcriptional regulator